MEIYTEIMSDEIEEQYKFISKNIKRLRLSKKITQESMALSMGFTTATFYTNAENNRQGKHFNLEHIIKISKIMNIPIGNIFD
jgi:transcriptional regulator with XRE-family HTH domain